MAKLNRVSMYEIGKTLSLSNLGNFCLVSKQMNKMCQDDYFWFLFLSQNNQSWIVKTKPETISLLNWYRILHNHTNDDPTKLLFFASEHGYLELLQYARHHGGVYQTGFTPADSALVVAADNGQIKIMDYLISNGANLDDVVHTIIERSIQNNRFEVLVNLLDQAKGLDIDIVFLYAAYYGNLDVIKYAVGRGANVHVDDNMALKWAREKGFTAVETYLLKF